MFHHPIYASKPNRDNGAIRAAWVPVFDRHGVHFVLNGHDHAYLRTHRLKNHQRVESGGTYYVVSVSGTKMYDQVERTETAVGFTETSTYQVFDVSPERLTYRSYDKAGRLRDEVSIER